MKWSGRGSHIDLAAVKEVSEHVPDTQTHCRRTSQSPATATFTPRATPDSERAKRPFLAEPSATDQELNPGNRVEGLGDFEKPTGEFGTVKQANEDDAIVKWDADGRQRLGQQWLKKI